jgi:hypothetical protein
MKTREGTTVRVDEAEAQERIVIATSEGHKLAVVRDAGSVRIMDGLGRAIRLDASGITIESGSRVSISAPTVEITTSVLTINAAVTKATGVLEADTVKCNTMIASTYTPGAGNIW